MKSLCFQSQTQWPYNWPPMAETVKTSHITVKSCILMETRMWKIRCKIFEYKNNKNIVETTISIYSFKDNLTRQEQLQEVCFSEEAVDYHAEEGVQKWPGGRGRAAATSASLDSFSYTLLAPNKAVSPCKVYWRQLNPF